MTTEDRVKARLDAELKNAKDTLTTAAKDFAAAKSTLDACAGKITKAADALEGSGITPTREKALADAHAAQGKAVRAFLSALHATQRAEARVATLENPKELPRRLKDAAKYGGDDTLSGKEAAKVVLLRAGKALHYTEITRLALESGVIRLDGKTPEATMSAYLAKAAKKGDTFVRVEPGIFDLAERVAAAQAKSA